MLTFFYKYYQETYSQYPARDDVGCVVNELIPRMLNLNGKQQLYIRRSGDNGEMSYILYSHVLDGKKGLLGICMVFDDKKYPSHITYLFDFFESLLSNYVEDGRLLFFDSNGIITSDESKVYEHSALIQMYSDRIVTNFNLEKANFVKYPQTYYEIAKSQTVILDYFSCETSTIKESVKYNHIVVITKEIEDENINSMRSLIKNSNDIVEDLNKQISKLKEQLNRAENKNDNKEQFKIINPGPILDVKKKRRYRHFILLLFLTIGWIVCLAFFYNKFNNEIKEKADQIADLENTIKEKDLTIVDRDSTILGLQSSISKLRNDFENVTSYSISTGANIRNNDNYDNGWILWIKAKQKVQIESFYIKSQTSGNVSIGLFDTNDNLIASVETNVNEGEFRTVIVDSEWIIDRGAYYMKILSGVSLQYHSSNDKEYSQFTGGALEVTGASGYSNRNDISKRTNHGYYQYFYNIKYHIIMNE